MAGAGLALWLFPSRVAVFPSLCFSASLLSGFQYSVRDGLTDPHILSVGNSAQMRVVNAASVSTNMVYLAAVWYLTAK